jgi:hypothetical protein
MIGNPSITYRGHKQQEYCYTYFPIKKMKSQCQLCLSTPPMTPTPIPQKTQKNHNVQDVQVVVLTLAGRKSTPSSVQNVTYAAAVVRLTWRTVDICWVSKASRVVLHPVTLRWLALHRQKYKRNTAPPVCGAAACSQEITIVTWLRCRP